jgi:DeoR/GlpR family transcriptional regulator of sugar metabolism
LEFIFSQGRQEYSKKIALKQCKSQGREGYIKKIALKQCKSQGRQLYSKKIALKMCKSHGRRGAIQPLTIVTNSMRVADVLREREWIDTYLIGGRVKPSGNITDVLANESVRQFKFDISFATGGGISDVGIFAATPEVAAFGRAVSAVSRRNIGIATHPIP